MKKIITLIILCLLTTPQVIATEAINTPSLITEPSSKNENTLEGAVELDWLSQKQNLIDENILNITNTVFKEDTITKYKRKDFKNRYLNYWKVKNYLQVYEDISNGKKEDDDKYYCGFFAKKLLVAYGIQYKAFMDNVYYYDALGNLRWVDNFSSNYPKYPYWSYQYSRNGKLTSVYYYNSSSDQYVFGPNKTFKGRWFKDKLYDKNAKVIMTRSNY